MTETATTTTLAEVVDTHLRAYCEPDENRRAGLLRAAWSPEGELIDPPFDGVGIDGISGMVDILLEHYPAHRFQRTTDIDAHHASARYGWSLVSPDGEHAVTGTDIVDLGDNGKIRRILGFFGDQPTTQTT